MAVYNMQLMMSLVALIVIDIYKYSIEKINTLSNWKECIYWGLKSQFNIFLNITIIERAPYSQSKADGT